MPKYRVEIEETRVTSKLVEADNPFMAAAIVGANGGTIMSVKGARAKRKLTPEAREKMVANAAKARAAKARKARKRT